MDRQLRDRYLERGRKFVFMDTPVRNMPVEELYAVIGYLIDKGGLETELRLRQERPLGAPQSDPPSNEGLLEG